MTSRTEVDMWLVTATRPVESVVNWAVRAEATHEELWGQDWEHVRAVPEPDYATTFARPPKTNWNSTATGTIARDFALSWIRRFLHGQRVPIQEIMEALSIIRCPDGKYRLRMEKSKYLRYLSIEESVLSVETVRHG